MWAVIFLCVLGLNVHQANGQRNSTQMYYVRLKIEESAITNLTEMLKPFIKKTNLKVENLEKTTICQSVPTGTECSCMSGFRWSDEVCQPPQKCCGDKKCTFKSDSKPAHCVSNKTVAIKGSVSLSGQKYIDCLNKDQPENFKKCNDKLLREIKTVYSTLRGFDTLTIISYRVGSIIADFIIIIADDVHPEELIEKSNLLNKTLSEPASFVLETTGVVQLIMPPSPVCYNDTPRLRCTLKEDLKTPPVWQLNRTGEVFQIFGGTESTITTETLETNLQLTNLSQRWEGEYTCAYHQKSDVYTISHKASAKMDIALLPDIHISIEPSFPRCKASSDLLNVKVKCEIGSSSESYTVSWGGENNVADISPYRVKTEVYAANTVFGCSKPTQNKLYCTFKNTCNETRTAPINVNIIYVDNQFCEAEDDWGDTKAGFPAVLKCKNAAGQRRRWCNAGSPKATWGKEVVECVNRKVDDVLQKAKIVDTGLGEVNKNAANVFSLLERVTNNSGTINTVANMDASIQVFSSLSGKLSRIDNETAVDDFLESSSNLLESSLNESWSKADKGNDSLAGRYLSSVEHLIQLTNITSSSKKTNLEVTASNCSQSSQCKNKVFNVSVVLKGSNPGSVKTAGFRELENYLPNKDKDKVPNSIVVSTTTEKDLESVEVKITFQLLKPRPRDVQMFCVAWDNNSNAWSGKGCRWQGSSDEGLCICEHLSSFAILMSRFPMDIDGLTEVTYVGLSVSVLSLIISLAIELTVWSAVVKTNISHLRHTAHVNISLCLLIADCCFLASSEPSNISDMWCQILVVLKHFCYLSMFFWMLCLSAILLHQAIFPFHNLSKKIQLRLSLFLGYVCPLLIVVITFLAYQAGSEGQYYSKKTCWLLYVGLLKGSIHTFIIPIGIIVFFNVFAMLVVIMKLLNHPMNTDKNNENEKKASVTVMRSVILLTPIFGVTWIFGFGVMLVDITAGAVAIVVNYAFTLLNAFQGLFILLTTCVGDKLTRDALLNRFKKKAPASTTDSTTKLDSTWKK